MAAALERALDKRLAALCELAPEAQAFLEREGVAGPEAFKVLLALEETVRNLIEHAQPSLTDRIQVRIEVAGGRVVLALEDDGPAFDPLVAPDFDPAQPLADREPHGMGVYLLRRFMDEIHYRRQGAVNHLELVVVPRP
jgi:anti-sigma regulatory factor (Ser/Thr protein kinase)